MGYNLLLRFWDGGRSDSFFVAVLSYLTIDSGCFKKQTVYRSRRRLGTWLLIAIRKHVNNLSVTLATDIAIECMTDNNNYWN